MLQLKLFLESAKFWIMGGLFAIILALSFVVHTKNNKIEDLQKEVGAVSLKLQTSNDSVSSLAAELENVTKVLSEKNRIEKETQAKIAEEIKKQEARDKSLVDLEAYLKSRKTKLNCSIPKDLQDAWNSL